MTSFFHNLENKLEISQSSSSAQADYITISSESTATAAITIDLSKYIIPPVSTITITDLDVPFSHPSGMWQPPEPFINSFPEWEEFNNMCKEYPGLEKVYEHMKAYYNMCKDDWEAKKRNEEG